MSSPWPPSSNRHYGVSANAASTASLLAPSIQPSRSTTPSSNVHAALARPPAPRLPSKVRICATIRVLDAERVPLTVQSESPYGVATPTWGGKAPPVAPSISDKVCGAVFTLRAAHNSLCLSSSCHPTLRHGVCSGMSVSRTMRCTTLIPSVTTRTTGEGTFLLGEDL